MRIAVAGGTGVVGSFVVSAAVAAGHDPVVLSRAAGVDLLTGAGVATAMDGVDVVIDVANVVTSSRRKATAFFEAAARNLLAARPPHLVVLSIVGVDRVPFGYYEAKLAQERAVAAGDVPWTVLRATQFHEFPGQLLDRVPGPVAVIPHMRSATIAAREVADELVRLAAGPPARMAPELAGPQVREMPELAREVLHARGERRRVLGVRAPGRAGALMAGDGLLPDDPAAFRGTQTFDEWLRRLPRRQK